ncbi:hypothetical protein CAOG_08245, partial [Capsaspora owczarzaki ATCC 30864]
MLENLVAGLLNKYLGQFVQGLDTKQLNLSLWSGNLVLENLQVRETAFSELDLPISVKAGTIGTLTLKIPWKNITTDPVVVLLDQVLVLATPNLDLDYDAKLQERIAERSKRSKIAEYESLKLQREEAELGAQEKSDSFAVKMATKIIDNIQVKISNIHVRLEGDKINNALPFAGGLTLARLDLHSTDQTFEINSSNTSGDLFYKLAVLDSLSVYLNTATDMLNGMAAAQLFPKLANQIARRDHAAPHNYIVEPISFTAE